MLNRVPVENRLDEDTQKRIAQAREEFKAGETTTVKNAEELNDFLTSL